MNSEGEFLTAADGAEVLRIAEAEDFDYAPVEQLGIAGGGLLMLVSEITGGERDWEIAIKGLASIMFVYPAILVLNALAFNCTSLWIISILCDAYLLFLFYNIGAYCMRGKQSNVIMVVAMLALFMATVYMTNYRIGWFMLKNASAALACLM